MPIDLWTPRFDEARLHPNFKTVRTVASKACLDVIDGWTGDFPDRDGKFVDEFQLSFDPSFWELYLHASFQELGYSPVYDNPSPDFELHRESNVLIAEAVVASNAGGYRPEWDKQGFIRAGEIDLHQAVRYTTIRISNAIVSKTRKYESSYKALPHVQSRPFVICVAPFDFPFSFDWSQAALRAVLFGLEQPMVHTDDDGNRIVVGVSEALSVTKDTGAEVPLALFRDDRLSHVSAVVFSSLATFSKVRALSDDPENCSYFRSERYNAYGTAPFVTTGQKPDYRESLLDGLIICLNPYATHIFDTTPFLNREVAVESWDHTRDEYWAHVPHEWLIRRFVFTARVGDKVSGNPHLTDQNDYKEFDRPKWPDRELRPVRAQIGPGINNHLGHISEWTVVVFQDAIDGTWHAMAVNLIVHSIPEFRDAKGNESIQSLIRLDDHTTREEAFTSICNAIDSEGGTR